MAFGKFGSLIERAVATVTAAGTTTLSNNSPSYQEFTGTTSQVVVLPDATTCPIGLKFDILNRSTGIVTVNYNGGSLAVTVAANSQTMFRAVDVSTNIGVWDITNEAGGSSVVSLSSTEKLGALAALGNELYQDSETTTSQIKPNPEDIGTDFWTTMNALPAGRDSTQSIGLNGYIYSCGGWNVSVLTPGPTSRYDLDNNYFLARANTANPVYQGLGLSTTFGYIIGGQTTGDVSFAVVQKYTDSTNVWSTVASLSVAEGDNSGFKIDGLMYSCGGNVGTTATYVYSETANAWYLRSPISSVHTYSAGFDLNNFGYLAGSSPGGTQVDKYNDAANVWMTVKALTTGRRGSGGSSIVGTGCVHGGFDGSSFLSSIEQYTDFTNSWKNRTSLTTTRYGQSQTSNGINGFIMAFGGSNGGSPLSSVEKYQPVSFFNVPVSKHTTVVPAAIYVSAALNAVTAAVPVRLRTDGDNWKYFEANKDSVLRLNDTLSTKFNSTLQPYWAGGTPDNATATITMQFYNDPTNSWITRQGMGNTRFGHGSFTVNGNAFVIDGQGTSNANRHSTEKYDDILNTWVAVATNTATNTPLGVHGFTIEGFGYAVGGSTNFANYNATVTTNTQYNDGLNSWSTKTAMPAGIAGGYSATQNNRGFVAAGHASGGAATNSNYRYNATSDSWATVATLTSSRDEGCGGASLNGFGYAVGGSGGPANAEKYNDSSNAWTTTGSLSVNHGAACQSAPSANGFVYAAGNGFASATSEKYNDGSNVWSSIASPTTDLAYGSAGASSGEYRDYQLQVGLPTYLAAVGSGQWIAKTNMVQTQAFGMSFTSGSSVYGAYGLDAESGGNRTNKLQKFDSTSNFWTMETPGTLSAADIGGLASSATLYGKGFFSGHNAAGSLDGQGLLYDTILKVWTSIANGPGSGQGNLCPVLNGFGYSISGGPGVAGQQTATNRYNPSTNTWATGVGTLNNRHYAGDAGVINGFIYAAGDVPSTNNEVYSDAANTWTNKASANSTFESSGTFVIGDGWHLAGNFSPLSNTHQVYKDASNVWVNSTVFPSSTGDPLGGSIGNDGYSCGGYNGAYTSIAYQWASAIQNIVLGAGLRVS